MAENLKNKEIVHIKENYKTTQIPLFVQKSNDEGKEFYYIGDLKPLTKHEKSFIEIKDGPIKVVQIIYQLDREIEDNMIKYLTN